MPSNTYDNWDADDLDYEDDWDEWEDEDYGYDQ